MTIPFKETLNPGIALMVLPTWFARSQGVVIEAYLRTDAIIFLSQAISERGTQYPAPAMVL